MTLTSYPLMLCLLCSLPLWTQAESADAKPIQVETLLKTTQSWDGSVLPSYAEGQPEVTILRITIAPGTALPEHQHPCMNAGVLLRGRLVVTLEGGKTLELEAGDSIAEVVGQWHYGRNPGDEPAEILVVYAGIEGQPVTVLKNAPATQNTSPSAAHP